MNKNGFTLVELLISIAIIGLLAAAILPAIDAAQVRARGVSVVREIDAVNQAFRIEFSQNVGGYPLDFEMCPGGCGNNPQINTLVDRDLLEIESELFPDINRASYRYDNDGDFYDAANCPSTTPTYAGVNVYIFQFLRNGGDLSPEVTEYLDELYDNGDGMACGRFRREGPTSNSVIFMMAAQSDRL